MKKHVSILITMLSFLLLPNITYADCTKEEIEHFKEIEDEFKVTYKYDKETNDYIMTFYYPDETIEKNYDLNMDVGLDAICKDISSKQTNCSNLIPKTYNIEISSNTETCPNVLKRITITIPKYNKYADDPLCKGIEDFVLCQPTYDKDISYEEFASRVETYKKTKGNNEKQEETQKKNNDNIIINYISNNYQILLIIITAAVAIILIIILMAKNLRQSRRLE